MVTLTTAGRRLTDRLIATHLADEARLLAGLSERQRDQLVGLLDVLAASVAAAE